MDGRRRVYPSGKSMIRREASRPIRWGAHVSTLPEMKIERRLLRARVAVRLEPGLRATRDSRETAAFAANQLSRFVPDVAIVLPARDDDSEMDKSLAQAAIDERGVRLLSSSRVNWDDYDAVLTVGRSVAFDRPTATVNSNGWVARMSAGGRSPLPLDRTEPNPIGALAAACLGVSAIALNLMGMPMPPVESEISLFDLSQGSPGSLPLGPSLPVRPMVLDALLVGCGGVSNGWAYAIRRLPIQGKLHAIDKQALREWNLGPYVCSTRAWLGRPKAEMLQNALAPHINVVPHSELLEHFKLRLDSGLVAMTPIVVVGLDEIPARHVVQRLWPDFLIDMAAGNTTTQLITHRRGSGSICLLEALKANRPGDAYKPLSMETGLAPERIRKNGTEVISQADVDAAPPRHRMALREAQRQRRQICGYISRHNLTREVDSNDFAAAAPFVTGLSGVVGAAATTRALMRLTEPVHHQLDIQAMASRVLRMACEPACECQGA